MSQYEPLRFEEREIISRVLRKNRSVRVIAKALGRHHPMIARESTVMADPRNTGPLAHSVEPRSFAK